MGRVEKGQERLQIMGKKAKQVPQKHLKNNNSGGVNGSGAVKKRAERETKLRLRKERVASKKNYASAEEKEFSSELLEKGLEVHVVDGDGAWGHAASHSLMHSHTFT